MRSNDKNENVNERQSDKCLRSEPKGSDVDMKHW